MASNSETMITFANGVAETLRVKSPLLRMKFARPLLATARITIDNLIRVIGELTDEVTKERQDAALITRRLDYAVSEMRTVKGNWKTEKPFAVVVSPYQFAKLRYARGMFTGVGFKQRKRGDGNGTTFQDIPVYTAKGVYGPLVLTEDAFNAFSRNAPELLLVAC